MHNEPFDNLIREKLSALLLAYQPGDWSLLAAQLDQAFDHQVREKLLSLDLSGEAPNWEALSSHLDQAFDQQLRARLQALAQDDQGQNWPLLAALLEQEPFDWALLRRLLALPTEAASEADWQDMLSHLEGDAFTAELRQKVEQVPPATPSAQDWEEMQAQLDQDFDRQLSEKLEQHPVEAASDEGWDHLEQQLPHGYFDQVFRQKLASPFLPWLEIDREADWERLEEALYAPQETQLRQQLQTHAAPEAPEWERMAALLTGEAAPAEVPATRARTAVPWPRLLMAAALLLLFLIGGIFTFGPERLVLLRHSQPKESLAVAPSIDTSADTSVASPSSSPATDGPPPHSGAAPTTAPQSEAGPPATLTEASPSAVEPIAAVQSPTLAASAPPALTPEASPLSPQAEPPSAPPVADINRISGSYGSYVSLADPQLRRHVTMETLVPPDDHPADIRIGLSAGLASTKAELSGRRARFGYQAGLRVEFSINSRWEVVSGLQYSQKYFTHEGYTPPEEGSLPYALDGSLQMLELPLMMRYRFTTEEAVSLYIQGGVVSALSLLESYDHYTPDLPSNALRVPFSPRQLEPAQRDWSLNSYPANIILAMGMEFQVSDRIFIQVEPFFLQSLQRTKGSGTLDLEKKLYTTGLNSSVTFDLKSE